MIEARRGRKASLASLSLVPRVGVASLGCRVLPAPLGLQGSPPEEGTALEGPLACLGCRETGDILGRPDRKVRRGTPVLTASLMGTLSPGHKDLQDPRGSQETLEHQELKVKEDFQETQGLLDLLVPPAPRACRGSQGRKEILVTPSELTE